MSRGYPSMTALLGLLAIAGYQNRDKLAEMLSGVGKGGSAAGSQGGIGGILSQITGSTGGASAGGFLSGGLSELVIGSGRTAKVQRQIRGSDQVPTSRLRRRSSSRQSAPTC